MPEWAPYVAAAAVPFLALMAATWWSSRTDRRARDSGFVTEAMARIEILTDERDEWKARALDCEAATRQRGRTHAGI